VSRFNVKQALRRLHYVGSPWPHGEGLLRAKRSELDPLVAELSDLAQGRHDIRTECAGIIAGAWFAKRIIMVKI
jgi:hypothetical protein